MRLSMLGMHGINELDRHVGKKGVSVMLVMFLGVPNLW